MNDRARRALVSGSGRNIGRAAAVALARMGFAVIVNGSRDRAACEATAEQVRAEGAEAHVAMADMADVKAVRAMAADLLARLGTVDVVVNNAAARPSTPFLETAEADWQRVMDLDLNAAVWTARAFLPGMVAQGWGRIVNMTGMHSIRGYSGRAPVSVAKHGLWGLTKALGKEFAAHGITVNAVSPGPIRGEYREPGLAGHNEAQLAQIPAGRLGEPEEIGGLVAYLCSDAAAFLNAQMIGVNGAMET